MLREPNIRLSVLARLPGLSRIFHLAPRDVWTLTLDEWVIYATALDEFIESQRHST